MKNNVKFILTLILIAVLSSAATLAISNANKEHLTEDEVCQKTFGKDYVFVKGRYNNDFCVDDSGTRKYPKTWKVKR